MKTWICFTMAICMARVMLAPAAPSVAQVTHTELQAVGASGEQNYNATEKVILEGILLHNPADMLDPTPDDSITDTFDMAGQWQIFFQGRGDDHAGTAVWMGQLYNNLPWVAPDGGYTNDEFIAELTRLNAAQFCPGDLIRVTGYYLSYNGKLNINEQHSKNPDHDFTIEVVEHGVGLPRPEVVTLDDLKNENDEFIGRLNQRLSQDQTFYGIASDFEPTGTFRELVKQTIANQVMDRVFQSTANDLVVPTEGVFRGDADLGLRIPDERTLRLGAEEGVTHTNYFAHPDVSQALTDWLLRSD